MGGGSRSSYPQLKGPHESVGFRIPNSRGHAKAWECGSVKERKKEERKKEKGKKDRTM